GGAGGIYVSDDAGGRWRALPHAPTDVVTVSAATLTRLDECSCGAGPQAPSSALMVAAPGALPQGSGGVYAIALAKGTVYASGDAGLHVSQDAGGHFTLVDAHRAFSSLAASTSSPSSAYALTGTTVYTTADAGRTWHATAPTGQHPSLVSTDPLNT